MIFLFIVSEKIYFLLWNRVYLMSHSNICICVYKSACNAFIFINCIETHCLHVLRYFTSFVYRDNSSNKLEIRQQ